MSIANELSGLWTKPMSDDACYVDLNPKAPQPVKDFVAEYFSFATRVSAIFMQERTGGFTDDGPALADYSAAILLENGELQLLKPCIPAADFDDPDCELTDCQRNDDKEQEALTMRIRVIKRSKFLKLLDRSGDRDAECLATIISRLQNLGDADRPDLPDVRGNPCGLCRSWSHHHGACEWGVMPSTLCHRCAGRYDSEITAAILQPLNK